MPKFLAVNNTLHSVNPSSCDGVGNFAKASNCFTPTKGKSILPQFQPIDNTWFTGNLTQETEVSVVITPDYALNFAFDGIYLIRTVNPHPTHIKVEGVFQNNTVVVLPKTEINFNSAYEVYIPFQTPIVCPQYKITFTCPVGGAWLNYCCLYVEKNPTELNFISSYIDKIEIDYEQYLPSNQNLVLFDGNYNNYIILPNTSYGSYAKIELTTSGCSYLENNRIGGVFVKATNHWFLPIVVTVSGFVPNPYGGVIAVSKSFPIANKHFLFDIRYVCGYSGFRHFTVQFSLPEFVPSFNVTYFFELDFFSYSSMGYLDNVFNLTYYILNELNCSGSFTPYFPINIEL